MCLKSYCSRRVAMVLSSSPRLASRQLTHLCQAGHAVSFQSFPCRFLRSVKSQWFSFEFGVFVCLSLGAGVAVPCRRTDGFFSVCLSLAGQRAFNKPSRAHSGCRCFVDAAESAAGGPATFRNMLVGLWPSCVPAERPRVRGQALIDSPQF